MRQIDLKWHHSKRLIKYGIILVKHLLNLDPKALAQKTKLSLEECEEILAAVKPRRPPYVIKASELMVRPFETVSTLVDELDMQLGGGIKTGRLIEISGEAAAGKSNLSTQIGLLVMFPDGKGLDSEVIYLHTEGDGKLKLAIKRFQKLAKSLDHGDLIEKKLHVKSISYEFELDAIIDRLPQSLKDKPKVKLIIIDSITNAFVSPDEVADFKHYCKRTLRLVSLVKKLYQIAWDNRVAIIITNHVAYNPKFGENRPAMGRIWSHMCQTKIYLERNVDRNTRTARVIKGAQNSPSVIEWTIQESLGLSCF